MADSSDIDAALCARLWNDPQLAALMPDGVHMDSAGQSPTTGKNATRYVLCSVFESLDVGVFGGRAFEDVLYLVQAVALVQPAGSGTPTGDVKAAAARIDALLEDQPLVVNGYAWMATFRERRHRTQEVDDLDSTIKWNRRGGFYRVQMNGGLTR